MTDTEFEELVWLLTDLNHRLEIVEGSDTGYAPDAQRFKKELNQLVMMRRKRREGN